MLSIFRTSHKYEGYQINPSNKTRTFNKKKLFERKSEFMVFSLCEHVSEHDSQVQSQAFNHLLIDFFFTLTIYP